MSRRLVNLFLRTCLGRRDTWASPQETRLISVAQVTGTGVLEFNSLSAQTLPLTSIETGMVVLTFSSLTSN